MTPPPHLPVTVQSRSPAVIDSSLLAAAVPAPCKRNPLSDPARMPSQDAEPVNVTSSQDAEPVNITSSQDAEPVNVTSSQDAEPVNVTSSQDAEPVNGCHLEPGCRACQRMSP